MEANTRNIQPGETLCGYQVQRVVKHEVLDAFIYQLEHTATRAVHIHIANDDPENTFGVAFKTVPADSTGVAHILEHTVLCGSRRYPVRDPFFSMLKRSLSTFMNAFTASDWTMYPFATQNRKDYYNLMSVYLDAVFHPRLEELSFKQEGHRLELEGEAIDPADPASYRLAYKGVVYNEMKGAMSSPDQVMVRSILKALYPDTTYSHNSGGDPEQIPSLTYDQLKQFHRRHYHPSNAYFYTYGNLPLSEHLRVIDTNVLSGFQRIDPGTDVPPQKRWLQPREVSFAYPFDRNRDPAKKSQACLAWLTPDVKDTSEVLAMTLLEQILLGNAASPIRKALIDSQLGSALCDGCGYDAENRDTLFVCGLKDMDASDAPQMESIVMEVLEGLVHDGIDPEMVDAAIHQIEFHRKEITNTPYPFGIKLLMSFAGSWIHGGDPVQILNFDSDLREIKAAAAAGAFFENRIRQYLLDNPHRIRMRLVPDSELEQKREERLRQTLEQIKQRLSRDDVESLLRDAEALQRLQEASEDMTCLPTLERRDIPPSVHLVRETSYDPKAALSVYRQTTSGISYFAAAAGAGRLPRDHVWLVPFFCYAFSRIGTTRRDYTEMARRIDSRTGGLGLSAQPRIRFGATDDCVPFIAMSAKCLNRHQAAMHDILQELIQDFAFSDHRRIRHLLLEYRSALESMVIHNGHRLAISLAARNFHPARKLSESWSGIHQLQEIRRTVDSLSDESLDALCGRLDRIGRLLFTRPNLQAAVIGGKETVSRGEDMARRWMTDLDPSGSSGFEAPDLKTDPAAIREGWSTATAVSFVAAVFQTVRMEHADAPVLALVSKMLRSMYLHREIREKGGAYGGFALYNPEDGLFGFASYRDPHIVSTLNAFRNAAEFIRSGAFGEEDVKEAILQVCSEIDKPDPPGPSARKAFYRKIIHLSDELRQDFKRRLLELDHRQVQQAAENYFGPQAESPCVAVISSEEKLSAANQKLDGEPLKLLKI